MFRKGKLVFTDSLEQQTADNGIPYFTARALVVIAEEGQATGTVQYLKISDLVAKQSQFVYDGMNSREAHKLYTWPVNLGDSNAWAASKRAFFEAHVMNFPIRVLAVDEEQHVTWEFITPEEFKQLPDNLEASDKFQDYLDHINEYFFLRKEKNELK